MSGIRDVSDIELIETEGMPSDLASSTYELIQRGAMIDPDAKALSFFLRVDDHQHPQVWTYRKLFGSITQTANMFYQLGIEKNDVIAFVLPNLPETHLTIWGGQAAGIVCAINPLLEPAAIAELLNASKAKVVVTLAPFPGTDLWTKVHSILDQVDSVCHVVLVSLASRVQGAKGDLARSVESREISLLHGSEGIRGGVPAQLGLHDFSDAIMRQPEERLLSRRVISPDDYSSYFCTGGTTGTPKIAMRRHRNEVANAWSAARFLGDAISADKNLFCGLPLFHVNGVLVTGLLPFSKGAHVILGTPQGYRGEGVISRFWELVEHHRINFFSGVPTLYATLLQVPVESHDISSLDFGLCGAAPMPVELMRNFQSTIGLKILEGYGLTEGTCISSINPPFGERRIGSIGFRIPMQKMKAVILDEKEAYLRDAAIGETGVIVISGPNVFDGYKIEQHNQGIWCETGDGVPWLNTGDLGMQDQNGYFYLTGRKKELIIRGSHNIDPQGIEEPLHQHPAVQLAAAVGRPDMHAGELPVVYVVLKPGASVTEMALMEFAQAKIRERAAHPKAIHIIDQMPLTGVGKVFKLGLKLREITSAVTAALEGVLSDAYTLDITHSGSGIRITVTVASEHEKQRALPILGQFAYPADIHLKEESKKSA